MARDPLEIYKIVVFLKDYEVEATEPMTEEVARKEFENLLPQIRIVDRAKMVRVGPNVVVRVSDILRAKLVKLGDEDDLEGEIGDDES